MDLQAGGDPARRNRILAITGQKKGEQKMRTERELREKNK